jgi:hypothetical protein
MIHGFPDYWYTWRHQMEGLADKFQVVAIDQRCCAALLAPALNNTWDFLQSDLTITTVPEAGHLCRPTLPRSSRRQCACGFCADAFHKKSPGQ